MTTERKRTLKAFIAKWELTMWAATALLYAAAIIATWLLRPKITDFQLGMLLLFSGLTSTLGSVAASIKADDDRK